MVVVGKVIGWVFGDLLYLFLVFVCFGVCVFMLGMMDIVLNLGMND